MKFQIKPVFFTRTLCSSLLVLLVSGLLVLIVSVSGSAETATYFQYGKSAPRMFERPKPEEVDIPFFLNESRDLPENMAQGREKASGPFLTFRDSTAFNREVVITFILPARGPVVVKLGTSPGVWNLESHEERPRRIHALVAGNLKPGVEYHYKICDPSGRILLPPASFTLSTGREFTFAAIGDTRTGSIAESRAIIDSILKGNGGAPDLLFFLGDQTPGGDLGEWLDFMDTWAPLCSRIPSIVIPGNHDFDSGVEWHSLIFPMPHDPPNTGQFFTLTAGKHRFICLDGGNFEKSVDFRTGQKDFLQAEIIRAAREKEKGTINWVVPVIHDSLVTVGAHAACEDVLGLRNEILGLFKAGELKPDLVLTSHDHSLQLNRYEGIPFLVSGAAGAPLTNSLHDPEGLGIIYASTRGYAWINAQAWKMDCDLIGISGSVGKCSILMGLPTSTEPPTIEIDGERDGSYGPDHLWEDNESSMDARLNENGLAVRLGGTLGKSGRGSPTTWVVALCRPVRGSGPSMLSLPSFLPGHERVILPNGGIVAFALATAEMPGTVIPKFYALNSGKGVNFSISRLQVSRQETWAANSGDGFEVRFPLMMVTDFFHTPGTNPGSTPLPTDLAVTAWSVSGSSLTAIIDQEIGNSQNNTNAHAGTHAGALVGTLATQKVRNLTSFVVSCRDPGVFSLEIRPVGSGQPLGLTREYTGKWSGHTDSIAPGPFSFTLVADGNRQEEVTEVYGLRGNQGPGSGATTGVRVSRGGKTIMFDAGTFR